jgi:glycosyltransferase involved in cell wall biosynthesis
VGSRHLRILFLTFYYPPDLSAGSFRGSALIRALLDAGGPELTVDIVTTAPNRYSTHKVAAPPLERQGLISIRRFTLPAHKSGMLDQALAFSSFAAKVAAWSVGKRWDLVVATSSRLMTAALGASVAGRIGAPLYLDIRDLFADTMDDLLRGRIAHCFVPALRWVERRTLRRAARVNAVSEGFLPYFRALEPRHDYRCFPNGIDDEFIDTDFSGPPRPPSRLPLVLYAGNIGEGQGLHEFMAEAANLCADRATFRIVGDGGRRTMLLESLQRASVRNVEVLDAVSRGRLLEHYREADVLFLHLNDHPAFTKVLPSKIFEYAATGKPILAGVAGNSARFIERHVTGAEVFAPCDATGMKAALGRLLDGPSRIDRSEFRDRFSRRRIMYRMAQDIIALVTARVRSG